MGSIAKALLSSVGVDYSVKDNQGQTILHIASAHGITEIVQKIINVTCATSVNETDVNGDTPLHLASRNGHASTVHLLMSVRDVKMLTNTDGHTPLLVAIINGRINVLNEFSQDIAQVNSGYLLFFACKYNQLEVLQSLIGDYGHCLQYKDSGGNSLLHFAALQNKPDIIELLVSKYKCSWRVLNSAKETPLHIAVKSEHIEVVKRLIDVQIAEGNAMAKQAVVQAAEEPQQRVQEVKQKVQQKILQVEQEAKLKIGKYEERTHQAKQLAEQAQQTAQRAEERVAQLGEQNQHAMQIVSQYEEDNIRLQDECQEYRDKQELKEWMLVERSNNNLLGLFLTMKL